MQRDIYRDRMKAVLNHLSRHPEMGPAKPEWGEGVRSFVVERHILIFRVLEETVEISRILDQHQDIERALGIKRPESLD